MTIFRIDAEWDCVALAERVKDVFKQRNFTDKKDRPLGDSSIFGVSENGRTAFIVEGFDSKNKFGIVVTLPTDKKEIHIIGGKYNETATLHAKYNKKFSDLTEASKYFETALKEYDTEIKK